MPPALSLRPSLLPGNEMTPMHACMRAARLPAWVIRNVVLEACAFITASPGVRRACGRSRYVRGS